MKNQNCWDTERYVGLSEIAILAYLFLVTLLIILIFQTSKEAETELKEVEKPIVIVLNSQNEKEVLRYIEVPKIESEEVEKSAEIEGREYLESCVEAEAGNQGELGKAYVCDVILNRLSLDDYSTVYDVINDPGQFQCVANGSIKRVVVSDETKEVVERELQKQKDSDIIFFRTGNYHSGTTPCFKYKDHYFSK